MATITLTDVVQGTPTDAGIINANNQELRTAINGGLDDTNIAADAQIDASKIAGGFTPNPSGTILAYAGSAAPSGYLLCDGSAVSRTTYAALFAICSTSYGAGNGSTTFNLPDLRGRVAVGLGTADDVDALGDNEGIAAVDLVSRSPYHNTSLTVATVTSGAGRPYVPTGGNGSNQDYVIGDDYANPDTPVDTPAFLTINYIIKT